MVQGVCTSNETRLEVSKLNGDSVCDQRGCHTDEDAVHRHHHVTLACVSLLDSTSLPRAFTQHSAQRDALSTTVCAITASHTHVCVGKGWRAALSLAQQPCGGGG